MSHIHWRGDPVSESRIARPDAEYVSVCSRTDAFQHGAAIAFYHGRFFVTFGRNEVKENSLGEMTVCYTSADGKSWHYHSVIGEASETLGRSHGILFVHQDKLYAYNARFTGNAHSDPAHPGEIVFPGLAADGFRFDEETDRWISVGTVSEDFWPLRAPVQVGKQWLISGIQSRFHSAYLLGSPETGWTMHQTPTGGKMYSETSCFTEGDTVYLLMRNSCSLSDEANRFLAIAESTDLGSAWQVYESDLSEADAKPFAGTLSDGRHILLSNSLPLQFRSRRNLTLSLTAPHSTAFDQMLLLRDGQTPPALADLYGDPPVPPAFCYPDCTEHGGKLYAVYSVWGGGGPNFNRIELAILPLTSL